VLLGRARVPGHQHPRLITVRGEDIVDITSEAAPTSRDVAEQADPAAYVASAKGPVIGNLHQLLANSWSGKTDLKAPSLLSPIDLQAVKAAGVTFVVSLLERVIDDLG
jgi:fumarylacetoacetate (FAA) hydrolase family protein